MFFTECDNLLTELNADLKWAYHLMVNGRVDCLKYFTLLFFLLKLLTDCDVCKVQNLAVYFFELQRHSLHNDCVIFSCIDFLFVR